MLGSSPRLLKIPLDRTYDVTYLFLVLSQRCVVNFEPGQIIQFSKEAGHLLPGRVLWTYENYLAAELDESEIDCEELENSGDQQFSLYYEKDRKFVQQSTQLEGVIERPAASEPTANDVLVMDLDTTANRVVIVFELLGTPTTADNRECYRVRATSYGINVVFADRDNCELMDISHTGFALLSDQEFTPGAIVRACLPHGDSAVCGNVRIQSVRQLRDGRFRYGVVCLGVKTEKACTGLAVELQRKQLQRHAGLVVN